MNLQEVVASIDNLPITRLNNLSSWRSSVALSLIKDLKITKSAGLSCFWGMPSFMYTEEFDFLVHSLINPDIQPIKNNTYGLIKEIPTDAINHSKIVENINQLFGNIFNVTLVETNCNEHFVYKLLHPYSINIRFLLLSNILSILRYIDVDYLAHVLRMVESKDTISTLKDVYIIGERMKNGSVGHNANDTVTKTFLRLGEVVIRNYLLNFSALTPEILLNPKYVKIIDRKVNAGCKGNYNKPWLGQTEHYNILISTAKEI